MLIKNSKSKSPQPEVTDPARIKKSLYTELAIYTVLFGLSFLFPIYLLYFLSADESQVITEPQYLNDFPLAYGYIVCFGMVLLATLSLKKRIVQIVSLLALVSLALLFAFIKLGLAQSGSGPMHPSLGLGYWFIHIVLLLLIVRCYVWSRRFPQLPMRIIRSHVLAALAIFLPVTATLYAFSRYAKTMNQPILQSEAIRQIDGRTIKTQTWDYMGSYSALVDKHFSKAVSGGEPFRLDSVSVTIFSDPSTVEKRFTRKAVHGKLNIEEVLENQ